MMDDKWYLKPNVVIEPLWDGWYAWPHLISPATAAMNLLNRHLKIFESYMQAPHIHVAAVKNPKMRGGPFMAHPSERLSEVRALFDDTLKTRAHLLLFAKALYELDHMLTTKATGYSLESLYDIVPELLKGYVELVYDLNNRPTYRLFEKLLYSSSYYCEQSQNIALWLTNNDERDFVLSTPKLADSNTVRLNIPFKSIEIDELAKMKRVPGSLDRITRLFGIADSDQAIFKSFFTVHEPKEYSRYTGDKIRMRYFGHACIFLESKEVTMLVDPVISYHGYSSEVSRFSDVDLPEKINYVMITHNHQDHALLETLLALRHRISTLVVPKNGAAGIQDPSLKMMFEELGFKNVIEVTDFEKILFENCEIMGLPFVGEHSDIDIKSKLCYRVRIGEHTVLFLADSCNVESKIYQKVAEITGPVDSIFLGMECDGAPLSWLYGPLLIKPISKDMDNSRRLAGSNYERGKALVDIFSPKEVYVYAMGLEPWLEFISSIKYTSESRPIKDSNRLIEYCISKGIRAERLFGEKEMFYEKNRNTYQACV